jgi:hypothetical protein
MISKYVHSSLTPLSITKWALGPLNWIGSGGTMLHGALGPLDGNMRFPLERRGPTPNAWGNPGCKQPVLVMLSPKLPVMRVKVGRTPY